MGELFGSIYCWLEDFFGIELANYLWGISAPEQTKNLFIGIGLLMLLISFVVVMVYYYLIDHPKLNNWWGWLIFLLSNAVINFIVGWQWVLTDFYDGLMVKISPTTGEMVDLPIYTSDMIAFGCTNMFDSIIAFVLFSYMFKWWSHNCSGAPL